MQKLFLTALPLLVVGCTRTPAPAQAAPPEEDVIFITIENQTPVALGVFFAEPESHTRLGHVDSTSVARLRVRTALLNYQTRFRVYAFRGPEACPVARMIDLSVSRTPRIVVTTTDSVVGDYLPGDVCRLLKK